MTNKLINGFLFGVLTTIGCYAMILAILSPTPFEQKVINSRQQQVNKQ